MALRNTEEEWLRQCGDSLLLGLMAYGIVPTSSTFLHIWCSQIGT